MHDSSYIIRNYRTSDLEGLVRLEGEAQRLAADESYPFSHHISERLGRPNYSPEQDLFLVEASGKIVGYLNIVPEPGIRRVVINCFIKSEHCRRGLATKLLYNAIKRARALGARVAHVNVVEGNTLAQRVLDKLGFQQVRLFHELSLELSEIPSLEMNAHLAISHFKKGEEDKLTEIQNRCFINTWGYNPNTEEEIKYDTRAGNCEPEGIIFAYEGQRLLGYCWTRIEHGGKSSAHAEKGRIYMIGVDPDSRNTGIGRRLLLAGLAYLKSKGLRVAQLTVDSENKVATALYHSVGFKIDTNSLWYEKALD
jgi:mycothiol synthase